MNKLQILFGPSAQWISVISWISIFLALIGAFSPLFFIGYTAFLTDNSATNINQLQEIFGDPRFFHAVVNSSFLAIIISVMLTSISAFSALIFRWCDLTGSRLVYGLSIVPLLIPDYVYGVVGRVICDPSIGLLSGWLPKDLLINRFSSLSVIAVISFLKWIPAMVAVADSSIFFMGQDELYQARMDYKSFFKAARFVYIPQMKEVLLVIASLGFLIGFRQHELAYELNSGGGGFVAETWSYWNYEVMFGFAKLSHAALESILILIILTIPIQIARKQAQRLSI